MNYKNLRKNMELSYIAKLGTNLKNKKSEITRYHVFTLSKI